MIAVIFEVIPYPQHKQAYFDAGAHLFAELSRIDGFISVERFESVSNPAKILSLSFWRDEQAIAQWRNLELHRQTQLAGRQSLFEDYRLRVAPVVRDYGLQEREQAPQDSRHFHTRVQD